MFVPVPEPSGVVRVLVSGFVFVSGLGVACVEVAMAALPLPFDPPIGVSFNEVHGSGGVSSVTSPWPKDSRVRGGSMSISFILDRSIMMSPLMAHPAVP